MSGSTEHPLTAVTWVDTTNIPTWETLSEVVEWAQEPTFICTNVGYLVYEDEHCVVLAARAAFGASPPQVGLFERIPKGVITDRCELDRRT